MASREVSPSHITTTQSFSMEILPTTEERKEKGDRRRTVTETQNVRLEEITNRSCGTIQDWKGSD